MRKKEKMLVASIFSWAVFGENLRYCYSLGNTVVCHRHRCCHAKTEDIYLKLGVCVHYPKSNSYYQGRQFKMLFFPRIMPLFNLDLLSSIKHRASKHWDLHAVLLFLFLAISKLPILIVVKIWDCGEKDFHIDDPVVLLKETCLLPCLV